MFFFFTSSHLKLVLEVWSNRVGAALGALTVVGLYNQIQQVVVSSFTTLGLESTYPGVEALASNRDENKPLGIE